MIQSRVLTGIGLVLAGGLLATLVAMGGGMQRDSGTLEGAFAAAPGQACAMPEDGQALSAEPQAQAACIAERRHPQTAAEVATAGEPAATAKPASRVPTYIRIGKPPEPEPEAASPVLEALRPSL